MSDELFDIFFSGKVINADEHDQVREKIGKLFNANQEVLKKLFSGQPVKIKKAVDMDTAIKYRVKFREAGAIVDIRPAAGVTAPAGDSIPQSRIQASDVYSPPASEASTGTDTGQAAAATPPGSLQASLDIPGVVIDSTPPPPPANIDTGSLSAAPANSGSLEEFNTRPAAVAVPDISHLGLASPQGTLDQTPPPPPAEIDTGNMTIDAFSGDLDQTPAPPPADIDTSALTAAPANTGSLEEFDSRPAPVAVPDTSKLDLAN